MAFYFFDTSALVKRYHHESGSGQVDAIFNDRDNDLIISELAIVELASALRRKQNRGEITVQALNDALTYFTRSVERSRRSRFPQWFHSAGQRPGVATWSQDFGRPTVDVCARVQSIGAGLCLCRRRIAPSCL